MGVLKTFVDFEEIQITAPYDIDNGGRIRPHDWYTE